MSETFIITEDRTKWGGIIVRMTERENRGVEVRFESTGSMSPESISDFKRQLEIYRKSHSSIKRELSPDEIRYKNSLINIMKHDQEGFTDDSEFTSYITRIIKAVESVK